MASQSVDLNCKKMVVSTNMLSKCNCFIFDVELDISYIANSAWDSCYNDNFYKGLSATIACQIGHKYEQWKVSSGAIACRLYNEFSSLKPTTSKWKGTISVAGWYIDEESVNGYSEIVYDWFTYDGLLTKSKGSGRTYIPDVFLQYTIRFVISPALPNAQNMYSIRGYKKIVKSNTTLWTLLNEKVNHEKEYSHHAIWGATDKHGYSLFR
ncbi:hypothetical protein PV327_010280 [Microctonus hyperodae]|uniref:Uncharacterized protein n=1 Tax=Microctonus hyperodae TaxID=165561 RepID=A0AA39KUR9_MICHY|nr:hypothetical protein PV327_010280 [Microctonus hyperodae]